MGTQVFNSETETDPETIIKYTRQPKKPPPYVPRSRSLGDLPGGLRVPIIKKHDSRLQQKHEANIAGLEELKMLRQKHGRMVEDLRITYTTPDLNQRRSCTSRLSSSSLASIQEEPGQQNGPNKNDDMFSKTRARFSISSDDSQIEENDKSKCSSLNSSSTDSLNQSEDKGNEPSETDNRTREQILADFRRNFEQSCGRPNIQARRASIQVVNLSSFRAHDQPDLSIRPKLRRASFQCEAVLTKTFEREEPVSKVISDFKLQYNFPSPIHAVTRQYGSSSDVRTVDTAEPSPIPVDRNFKNILEQWDIDKTLQSTNCSNEQTNKSKYSSTAGTTTLHSRNLSFTSDYFGSTETLNTINTCPLPSPNHEQKLPRRQSLPTNLTRNHSQSDSVPKLQERRRLSFDNTNGKDDYLGNESMENTGQSKLKKYSNSESDDGIFYEEDICIPNSLEITESEDVPTLPERTYPPLNKSLSQQYNYVSREGTKETNKSEQTKENNPNLLQAQKLKEKTNVKAKMTLETAV